MSIPRPEYPNPIFERKSWLNLNGEWDFEICENGFESTYPKSKITVPFCPESKLSGIGHKGFMEHVRYTRTFTLPDTMLRKRFRIYLRFGACDYRTEAFVNGISAGIHSGGYSSFSFDITDLLADGANTLTVQADDYQRSGCQPSGKQSPGEESFGCFYTRTTGIWQTVWLEAVPEKHIVSFRTIGKTDGTVTVTVRKSGDGAVTCRALYGENVVGEATGSDEITMRLTDVRLWDVGKGELYGLVLEYGDDIVYSYFGLREVSLKDGAFCLNGKKVFGRWVLDQGFYPDGIYTAPNEAALKADIDNSIELGFNGARLHQKIFEPRFLYLADKAGYLVWEEHANWGLDITDINATDNFIPEWKECMERDFNHPSVIGWCPLNETWDTGDGKRQCDDVLRQIYDETKKLDATRPVIDTSGNFHVVTDIFDIHDYEQDPAIFAEHYDGKMFFNFTDRQTYNGEPYFISEYGGIKWAVGDDNGWGYGNGPKTEKEFLERYASLTRTLLSNCKVFGFCYTQLYDVEQELNGLMTYRREFKFPPEVIKEINLQIAAIETQD